MHRAAAHFGLEILGAPAETCGPEIAYAMHDDNAASPIDDALRRLDAALLRLESVVARRLEAEAVPDDRDAELAIMDADRARLADALDAASARLAEVEAGTGAVGRRLDRAIAGVEGVLARS